MKKQNLLLLILLSWLAGLACCSLFTGRNKKLSVSPASIGIKTITHQLKQAEENHQRSILAVQQQNRQLQSALQNNRAALTALNRQNKSLRASLQNAIRQQQQYKADNDTVQLISQCDTLVAAGLAYMASAEQKDSLQESVTQNLLTQLHNRDTIISLQKSFYSQLRKEFDNTLSVVMQQQKTIRKQRITGTLKNAGLLILTGFLLKNHL